MKKKILFLNILTCVDRYGIEVGLKSFRKHLGWYSKSLKNSNEFRFKVNKCNGKD